MDDGCPEPTTRKDFIYQHGDQVNYNVKEQWHAIYCHLSASASSDFMALHKWLYLFTYALIHDMKN